MWNEYFACGLLVRELLGIAIRSVVHLALDGTGATKWSLSLTEAGQKELYVIDLFLGYICTLFHNAHYLTRPGKELDGQNQIANAYYAGAVTNQVQQFI